MEFADGGDLYSMLQKRSGVYLPESDILDLFVQVIQRAFLYQLAPSGWFIKIAFCACTLCVATGLSSVEACPWSQDCSSWHQGQCNTKYLHGPQITSLASTALDDSSITPFILSKTKFPPQSQNIFMTCSGILKLGDFGVAKVRKWEPRRRDTIGCYDLLYIYNLLLMMTP